MSHHISYCISVLLGSELFSVCASVCVCVRVSRTLKTKLSKILNKVKFSGAAHCFQTIRYVMEYRPENRALPFTFHPYEKQKWGRKREVVLGLLFFFLSLSSPGGGRNRTRKRAEKAWVNHTAAAEAIAASYRGHESWLSCSCTRQGIAQLSLLQERGFGRTASQTIFAR